mmetsp:Transcript_87967/g.247163  ORF Transcript_87967/g.247163 Transcript_87967/m.247163 type:complete len:465 (-) Transcript_87967:122-1516(-)|eukprot:CAMPEP_0117530364 /NCGR_PEP_ID=MMETSP0784-20121206/38306_1 /TAXON_ID=39447 /ORGANISM="" /LENGTH=464 /DNA_ID=CAMNT_0005326707 /DNA_START=23 /DNA_END=1414 /DNA_ORIENTATION=+
MPEFQGDLGEVARKVAREQVSDRLSETARRQEIDRGSEELGEELEKARIAAEAARARAQEVKRRLQEEKDRAQQERETELRKRVEERNLQCKQLGAVLASMGGGKPEHWSAAKMIEMESEHRKAKKRAAELEKDFLELQREVEERLRATEEVFHAATQRSVRDAVARVERDAEERLIQKEEEARAAVEAAIARAEKAEEELRGRNETFQSAIEEASATARAKAKEEFQARVAEAMRAAEDAKERARRDAEEAARSKVLEAERALEQSTARAERAEEELRRRRDQAEAAHEARLARLESIVLAQRQEAIRIEQPDSPASTTWASPKAVEIPSEESLVAGITQAALMKACDVPEDTVDNEGAASRLNDSSKALSQDIAQPKAEPSAQILEMQREFEELSGNKEQLVHDVDRVRNMVQAMQRELRGIVDASSKAAAARKSKKSRHKAMKDGSAVKRAAKQRGLPEGA